MPAQRVQEDVTSPNENENVPGEVSEKKQSRTFVQTFYLGTLDNSQLLNVFNIIPISEFVLNLQFYS